MQKIQNFTKSNPEFSVKFYMSINDIYNEEISTYQAVQSSLSQYPNIKNPLVIKSRGRLANKHIKSSLEKRKKARISE